VRGIWGMRGIRRAVVFIAGLAGLAMAAVISFPVAATAASVCYTANGCPTTTIPGQVPKAPATPPSTTDPVHTQAAGATLPFTGTDVMQLVGIGGAALLGGALLVRASRKRRST
jgi:LPXTG-motif cell wall-anchored protein